MSILQTLTIAKENVAKFKKAKCMLEWLQHRKTNLETLHIDAVRLAKEYTEQAAHTAKLLGEVAQQLDTFSKFIVDNETTIDDSKNAEAIAAKINKLQKEIAALQEKLEAENVRKPDSTS